MRFEVKGGGITAILFAMTVLSGVVFLLGLLAGYDVGRQAQIDTNQLATSYPLQPAPATPATPNQTPPQTGSPAVQSASSSGLPAAEKPRAMTSAPREATSPGAPASAGLGASQPSAAPAGRRFAAASIPSRAQSGPTHSPAVTGAASADSEEGDAVDESSVGDASEAGHRIPAPVHHKPYNIQIEAAMDIKGADQMMARLQKLGYTSHLVPTEIAGQRWYKVEVGPYATAQDATTAEAELRQRYDATYGGVARGNSAAENSANVDSEE